jgi:hypothetical protein
MDEDTDPVEPSGQYCSFVHRIPPLLAQKSTDVLYVRGAVPVYVIHVGSEHLYAGAGFTQTAK